MFTILLLLSPMVISHPSPTLQQASMLDPSMHVSRSEDIIEQTRAQAELLKEHLWSIAESPDNTEIVNKVFAEKNTACIGSIEDAVEAVEEGVKLVQNAGAELKHLVEAVQIFNATVTPVLVVKESATIIRILDVLIPKITPSSQSYCGDADQFASFSSLVVIIDELASKEDLHFSLHKKQNLKSSAKIVSHVINFLAQLKTSFSKFDRLCTMDKNYNIAVIHTIVSLMKDLADLYTNLGGLTAAAEIMKNESFVKQAVGNIEKLRDLDLISLDCNTPWKLELIAGTMDDLAQLMEDVGMENLCRELNLDCLL